MKIVLPYDVIPSQISLDHYLPSLFYFAIFLSLFCFKCSNIHQFNDFITSVKASLHFYVVEYRTKKLFNYYSDKNMLC